MNGNDAADWHGTDQWQRHIKEGTKLCDPCRLVRNRQARERRHRDGTSKGTWIYVPDPPKLTDDNYQI